MTKTALIRTLPLRRGNYGCLLQAFALQHALKELGIVSVIDMSERSTLPAGARVYAASLVSKILRRPLGYRERERSVNAEVWRFIRERLSTDCVFGMRGSARKRVYQKFDAFIAGSDQVWRSEYGDVSSYLFDFVEMPRKKIAYAASFGTDRPSLDWAGTAPLVQEFDAVSVRELSAVELCRENWSVNAIRVPDPTFLPELEEYVKLAETSAAAQPSKYLGTYVLDESLVSARAVREVERVLALPVHDLHRPKPESGADLRREPDRFERISVESWLRGIIESEFVVTDSFHGTVFAILFNRPFITVANSARGLARFESLLSIFNLRDRLILATGETDLHAELQSALGSSIDWVAVNERVALERELGRAFLQDALS